MVRQKVSPAKNAGLRIEELETTPLTVWPNGFLEDSHDGFQPQNHHNHDGPPLQRHHNVPAQRHHSLPQQRRHSLQPQSHHRVPQQTPQMAPRYRFVDYDSTPGGSSGVSSLTQSFEQSAVTSYFSHYGTAERSSNWATPMNRYGGRVQSESLDFTGLASETFSSPLKKLWHNRV